MRSFPVRPAVLVSLALLVLLAGGCPILPGLGGQSGEPKLVPFASSQDLLDYFKAQASARISRSSSFLPGALDDLAATGEQAGGTGADAANGDSYSTTNIQEAGVDESDVFKSDGTYFYIAREQSLRIVQASPAEQMAEVARLDLGVWLDSLYLLDSTVIALGMTYAEYGPDETAPLIWPPYYRRASLMVFQIDVSDPANPVIDQQVELDGSLVSSRLTNGRLIVVLTIVPELPANPTRLAIQSMTLEDVMPRMCVGSATAEGGAGMEMVPWQRWLHPVSPDGYNMTAVVTLDASAIESVVESVAVLANAGTVYASPQALYITDAECDPADHYREKTAVHKFAFDENGVARYAASGSVPGRLLNQFSLGEHQGYLRAATHISSFRAFTGFSLDIAVAEVGGVGIDAEPRAQGDAGDRQQQSADVDPPYNAVYVLGEVEERLDVVGFVDGIAPTERIYSARFMGDRGFLVTFRQIDPLFTLDLSDPQNPTVVGELKIPGYSDYLHPLGQTHLIGVGRSTGETLWGEGPADALQLSLFDVSDLANPTLVEQITLGGQYSYSEVSRTHKAFTLITREGQTLLAIPALLMPEQSGCHEVEFDGVLCYQVDPAAGFSALGRVSSVTSGREWWPRWRRAAFIGDVLYALTPSGVRAASLADFNVTHAVTVTD